MHIERRAAARRASSRARQRTLRRLRLASLGVAGVALVSCSATQVETARNIALTSARATAAALPLIGRVVTAYGSPYADLIVAFAEAVSPNRDEDDGDWGEDDGDWGEDDGDWGEDDGDWGEDDGDWEDDEGWGDENQDGVVSNFGATLTSVERRQASGELPPAGDELVAQVEIVRESLVDGRYAVTPVTDGDVLTSEDNYKVQIGCDRPCYAYVAQLDATGRMDPIVPGGLAAVGNPLPAGRVQSIPEGTDWFFLDESTGVEQVHFILSARPRPDIERILERVAAANVGLERLEKVEVEPGEVMPLTRGIGGVRQGEAVSVATSDGGEGRYAATLLESIDAEVVVTRWFRHE